MSEITTHEDTGYRTENPITTRNFGIMGRQLNECRSGALTPSGVVERRSRRSPDMGSVRIPLSSRKYPNLYTLIDEEDVDLVTAFTWSVWPYRSGYRVYRRSSSGGKQRKVYLSRMIVGAQEGQYVDHINGDTLDNRRANLRICSNQENLRNRGRNRNNASGFKGVFWNNGNRRWQAKVGAGGKVAWSAYFDDPVEAARGYDEAARRIHGEFAVTNAALGLLPKEDS